MTLPTQLVMLPESTREVVIGAVDYVLRFGAKGTYAPATAGGSSTGWVDFFVWAAQDARNQVAGMSAVDGMIPLELNLPEVEALDKLLLRSRYVDAKRHPERNKIAKEARKALHRNDSGE